MSETKKNEIAPLQKFIDTDKLKTDVSVNPNDLDDALMSHASLYVYYAEQTTKARRQYERTKSGLEILEATLYRQFREQFSAEGRKTTEKELESAIKTDLKWSAAEARLIDAQAIWKLCEAAESAFVQRKDLILEVARDRRKEREGQLRVSEANNLRDGVLSTLRNAGNGTPA